MKPKTEKKTLGMCAVGTKPDQRINLIIYGRNTEFLLWLFFFFAVREDIQNGQHNHFIN